MAEISASHIPGKAYTDIAVCSSPGASLLTPTPHCGTAELLLRPVDVPHANAVSATGNTTTRCTRAGISPRAYTPVVAAFNASYNTIPYLVQGFQLMPKMP